MPSPVLILPVESRVRELDAKLLLAGAAVERGFRVYLGGRQQVSFALPRLPRGVFFAKSMRFTSDRVTRHLQGLGHRLVASDEESLVRFQHPDYFAWRFSPGTFGALQHLFAWGPDDAEMLRGYPGRGSVEIHATGNPRMDLLRGDLREAFRCTASALRRRLGRFILINSNFSFVHNFVPDLNLLQAGRAGSLRVSRTGQGMSLPFALQMAEHQQTIADAFDAMLPVLAARFPRHNIVVRPHPSEDHDRWRRQADHLPNVAVIHEDNVVPWLMAAEVLIHNGCTTAVEAAVLGTPAVSYQPVTSVEHDYPLPNRLSHSVVSEEALLETIGGILCGRAPGRNEDNCRLLGRHLTWSPTELAVDRIMDVLAGAGYLDGAPPAPAWPSRARAWLGLHGRTLVKRVNGRRRGHRNSRAYLRHRFPPLAAAEVNRRLAVLGAAVRRFGDIEATRLAPDLFVLDRLRRRPYGA